MKKFALACIVFTLLTACDDGDIIVTTFDFDQDTQLTLCGQNNRKVLYTVNSQPNESIAFSFDGPDYDGMLHEDDPTVTSKEIQIDLNSSNRIIYRTYDGEVSGSNYFCVDIPPSKPTVIEEYTSTNGGYVSIITTIVEQDDNDGLAAEMEDLNGNGNYFDDDSDGDGIPDFLDTDDDNDNIPTKYEINIDNYPEGTPVVVINGQSFPDSDGDGIPNYLDEDDDGDGVLTRYEDINVYDNLEDGQEEPDRYDPRDDKIGSELPNYLDPTKTESLEIDKYNKNVISRKFKTRVVAKNVTMKSADGEESITESTLILGQFEVTSDDVELKLYVE